MLLSGTRSATANMQSSSVKMFFFHHKEVMNRAQVVFAHSTNDSTIVIVVAYNARGKCIYMHIFRDYCEINHSYLTTFNHTFTKR